MRGIVLGALILGAMAAPVRAQVHVDIGIHLPGPPAFVVIPETPVYYAPRAPANIFLYGHQYWAFANGGWYVGPTWNGPWAGVEPPYVPVPILKVPVRYYRVPPPHWKGWRREGPPEWGPVYGREWREESRERSWREREEQWGKGKGCPPGLAKQGRC